MTAADLKSTKTPFIIALAVLALHLITNHNYGFHRDELQTLDDARHLAWGYVAYPPLTPFFGRLAQILFGQSLWAARVFPSLAQTICIVLGGWIARELGGGRRAQIIAALAVAIAPVSLAAGALLQYVTFDYLWWVLTAFLVARLLRTENDKLWLAIGAVIGLGMMTKYTMGFLALGIAFGVVVTDARRCLKSPWLWIGALLSVVIFLPHIWWQYQHHFITRDFLQYIHARDIRIGRTKDFLSEQLWVAANFVTIPLWIAGLVFYFFRDEGRRFRVLGWMFVVPFLLFVIAKGRGYYMAPAYPMLLAAGAVVLDQGIAELTFTRSQLAYAATLLMLVSGGALVSLGTLPVLHPTSSLFKKINSGDFRDEIGWPELVAEVARIRDTLPESDRQQLGILAGNYGEAGAVNMFRSHHGLPEAISGTNTYWLRGYPTPPPDTLIVLGLSRRYSDELFESCKLAGHNTNTYGIHNEESDDHPDIYVCRNLKQPWPVFWANFRHFG
jgi:hypothetical protein